MKKIFILLLTTFMLISCSSGYLGKYSVCLLYTSIYVADTIANLRDEWDNQYMNVYAINSKGEIKNKIENVSCFRCV